MRYLCGDIGGTNASLCLAKVEKQIEIGRIERLSTQDHRSFPDLINAYLDGCEEKPVSACFAVAGVVRDQRVEMTNANLIVDAQEILSRTPLKSVQVINDFDAVGYAINVLDSSDVVVLNEGIPQEKGVKCAIGAGTGLGKSRLHFDQTANIYLPSPSEGGHADFALATKDEWMFVEDMPQTTWENLVSGSGIERIYRRLSALNYPNHPQRLSAEEISSRRHEDELCRETFRWFVKFYARAARNFTLELLAGGGLYLAGGIGASNRDIFNDVFMEEYTRHHLPHFRQLLQNVPVHLITNYNISLKGAALAQAMKST